MTTPHNSATARAFARARAADPYTQLLSDLRVDIARITVLIEIEQEGLLNNWPRPHWGQASRAFRAFEAALAAGNRRRAQAHLRSFARTIRTGDQIGALARLNRRIALRCRLVETYKRIERDMNQSFTPEEAELMIAVLADAVAAHVPDGGDRRRIHDRFSTEIDRFNQPGRPTLSAERCGLAALIKDED